MTGTAAPYRLSTVVPLLGVALAVVVLGGGADRQYCDDSQRVTSRVNVDHASAQSPSLRRGVAHDARSFVDTGQDSTPPLECNSNSPAGDPSAVSTRSVRLTDHTDGETQETNRLSLNSIRASGESQSERPVSSPLVSRPQGDLGTVRSVVLRL